MTITKKTEGHLTITDLTDITDVYLEYCLALNSANADAVSKRGTASGIAWQTGEVSWSTTYPTWVSGYQIWIRQVRIKEGMANPEYGTPYLDTAVNQINNNYINLNNKIKKIWSNSTGSYMASGIGNNDVNENNVSTYGYNSKSTTTGISFNYNAIPLIEMGILDSGNFSGIKLYSPILTNSTISSSRLDATLTSWGLKLIKGGIKAGDPNQSGFIYLSTENYPLREFILTEDQTIDNTKTYYQFDSNSQTYIDVEEPDISEINTYYELTEAGISINNYTPTKGNNNLGTISNPAWRQIIGTKFGVDSAGNLYASNANISGTIYANAGEIGDFTITNDLYSGQLGEEESVWISPGTEQTASIGGSASSVNNWAFAAGDKFGVTAGGDLYASNAIISGTITITNNNSNIYTKDEAEDLTNAIQNTIEANLNDLSKVVNIEDWILKYGHCELTTDTEAQEGKLYFNINKQVVIPTVNPQLQDYYELESGATWILTTDTIIDGNQQYYKQYTYYILIEPVGNENPFTEDWYEFSNDIYIKTTDTTIDGNKQYYEQHTYYTPVQPIGNENPFTEQWYELFNDTYIKTTDTTISENKLYFLRFEEIDSNPPIYFYKVITEYIPNPAALELYELTRVDKSISNYINTHIKLENGAIIIQADDSDACIHISIDGIVLKDNNGTPVASFAKSIILGNRSEMHLELSPGDASNNIAPELGFYDGNTKVAYINSDTLNINQGEIKEKLRIGQFEWKTQGANRISLVYAPQN